MKPALFFAALALGAAFAQNQPQLAWSGEVDGTVLLHVRGDRLDIEERTGAPVQRDRSQFHARLPELRQDVRVDVVESRGRVRVLQQPSAQNNFTFTVQIEDPAPGRALYSLQFHWSTPTRSPLVLGGGVRSSGRSHSGEERLSWTGRVDDEVIVECRGNECIARQVRGAAVTRDRYVVTRPLPEREIRVSLDDVSGRGEVDVMEQPSAGNGYAAKVRIRDRDGGSDDYAFALYWTRPARNEPDRLFARPGMTWRGRVDGTVRLSIAGGSSETAVVSGGPIGEERYQFERALPGSETPNVAVRKIRGRGRVEIVEFPSRRNGHRLVIEIADTAGGSDVYEVEVGW